MKIYFSLHLLIELYVFIYLFFSLDPFISVRQNIRKIKVDPTTVSPIRTSLTQQNTFWLIDPRFTNTTTSVRTYELTVQKQKKKLLLKLASHIPRTQQKSTDPLTHMSLMEQHIRTDEITFYLT